jgi:hypothetical protein
MKGVIDYKFLLILNAVILEFGLIHAFDLFQGLE